ncbi:MAG: hypothetical protein JRI68_24660, partial [Deltaproteobacteria bacterium]|nr:hypothetical protein [Deltaproteobacteria bacterium]
MGSWPPRRRGGNPNQLKHGHAIHPKLNLMPRKSISQVRRRMPAGYELPSRFDAFMDADPPVRIEWTSFKHYDLRQSASKEAVPFIRLPDGGLVAFWLYGSSMPIVHIGGHGELEVIAVDFEHFLKAINTKSTGLSDFDDA